MTTTTTKTKTARMTPESSAQSLVNTNDDDNETSILRGDDNQNDNNNDEDEDSTNDAGMKCSVVGRRLSMSAASERRHGMESPEDRTLAEERGSICILSLHGDDGERIFRYSDTGSPVGATMAMSPATTMTTTAMIPTMPSLDD